MTRLALALAVLAPAAPQDESLEKYVRRCLERLKHDDARVRNSAAYDLLHGADRLTGALLDDAIAAVEDRLQGEREAYVVRGCEETLKALKAQKAGPRKLKEEREVTPEEVDRAIERAVAYLLKHQAEDGAWGGGFGKEILSYTAFGVLALLESPQSAKKEVQEAVDRAVGFLLKRVDADLFRARQEDFVRIREGATSVKAPPHFTSDAANVVTVLLRVRALERFSADPARKPVDAAVRACLKAIKECQSKDGGWSKYSGDAPKANFMVAEVMQALGAAKEAGFEVEEESVRRAVRWMEDQAKGDYRYLGDAISRRVAGELALAACGADRKEALAAAVERFMKDRAVLEWIRPRRHTHQHDLGALSTTAYMYGYFHLARALKRLGGAAAEKHRPALVKTFVNTQEADGSWKCGPSPDATDPYNASMGLVVLSLGSARR